MYTITTTFACAQTIAVIAATLQRCYDEGADGSFMLHAAGPGEVRAVFDREEATDSEYLAPRIPDLLLTQDLPGQAFQAAGRQLADEIKEGLDAEAAANLRSLFNNLASDRYQVDHLDEVVDALKEQAQTMLATG